MIAYVDFILKFKYLNEFVYEIVNQNVLSSTSYDNKQWIMIRTYTFITEMSKVCTIAAIMIEMRVDIDFEKVVGLLPTKNLNNGSS